MNSLDRYYDEKVIEFVKYCLEDSDAKQGSVSYGYSDVNTKENMPYSALIRRGIMKDGVNVLVYDAELAQEWII